MRIGLFPDWWQVLTPEEQRIAKLIPQGLTNRQIAEELNVTEQAIKDQILVIFQKTGCGSRLELALAIANGL